ncbi:hypothetical protein BHE74_00036540, partial [Ensete ventricosum]
TKRRSQRRETRDERREANGDEPVTYSPSQSSESRQRQKQRQKQKRRLFQKTAWTRHRPACLYPISLWYAIELFDVLPTRRPLRGIDFVPCGSRDGRYQSCLRIYLPGVRSDHGHRIRVSKLRHCSKPQLSGKCLRRILIILLLSSMTSKMN